MNEIIQTVLEQMKLRFGEAVKDVTEFRGDVVVTVAKEAIVDICTFVRDNTYCPFPLCEDVFGIDQDRSRDRFEVNYHFFSIEKHVRIHLKVKVDEDDAALPSITSVYPSANWPEREAFDMYGIAFHNHPDLRRMYMPEEFEHYPLRKDFPLMGIPGSLPLPK